MGLNLNPTTDNNISTKGRKMKSLPVFCLLFGLLFASPALESSELTHNNATGVRVKRGLVYCSQYIWEGCCPQCWFNDWQKRDDAATKGNCYDRRYSYNYSHFGTCYCCSCC